MRLIHSFIKQVFIWIYTFISFGFWLIFFRLGIVSGIALAVCLWYVGFLEWVLNTFAVVTVWFDPNDSGKGEYVRAISVSYMIAYIYF